MSDYDFTGLTNPKRVAERRLAEAERSVNTGGRDMGDMPSEKVQMSQAQFSGYSKRGRNQPPSSILKKNDKED